MRFQPITKNGRLITTNAMPSFCNICLNLQNFGIDQCYTQRYAAAKDLKAARSSIWTSSWMYSGITLLFTLIGTLLWMFNRANPGVIPAGTTADQVFPWFIVNKLPPGISGLLMAAIIAAAMSTIAATLNSGATVMLEDYWKRFAALSPVWLRTSNN